MPYVALLGIKDRELLSGSELELRARHANVRLKRRLGTFHIGCNI